MLNQRYAYSDIYFSGPSLRLLLGNCRVCLVVRVRGIDMYYWLTHCSGVVWQMAPVQWLPHDYWRAKRTYLVVGIKCTYCNVL